MSYSYFLVLKIIFEFLKAFLIFPIVILLFILIFSPTQPFSFIILIISFFVLPPGDFFPKLLQKKTLITFQSALYLFHYQQTRNHFIQHLLTQEFQVLLLIQLELIHLQMMNQNRMFKLMTQKLAQHQVIYIKHHPYYYHAHTQLKLIKCHHRKLSFLLLFSIPKLIFILVFKMLTFL